MKSQRLGARISAAVCAAAIILTPALATATTGYVNTEVLNVRQERSLDSEVIWKFAQGDTINITNMDDVNWYKITTSAGLEGFIFANYISFTPVEAIVPPEPPPPPIQEQLVNYARKFIGVPYSYGANGPNSFDCSGFVKYVYANFGYSLPRTTYTQINCGTSVSYDNMKQGDLVFFRSGGHVGMYTGNGMYIHAPQTGDVVKEVPLTRSVYAIRRIL